MRLTRPGYYLLAAAALSMSGCTAVFSDVRETWNYATATQEDITLSAQEIADFPYTAVYVTRGEQPRALVVLGFADDEVIRDVSATAGAEPVTRLQWVSADREVMETRLGRVVRTFQLGPDLLAVSNLEQDPLQCVQQAMSQTGFAADFSACNLLWQHDIDIQHSRRYAGQQAGQVSAVRGGMRVSSQRLQGQFEVGEVTTLALPAGEVRALQVSEQVTGLPVPGREPVSYRNEFWLADDGHVLRSKQYVVPGSAPLVFEQVKWVGRDD